MYELYVKQKIFKITDHYEVFDKNQNPVYMVDQDFKLIGNTVHVKKLDATKSFVVDKELFTFMPKYIVRFDDGKSFVIKQNFTFFVKSIDVISDDYKLNLEGNFWDMTFKVYDNGKLVGQIEKELFAWGDTFVIQVIDSEYEEELVALLIAVDNIQDNEKN